MSNVDKLSTILKALYEKPGATVQDALDALQRLAPTPTEREKTDEDYSELVAKYKKSQAAMKVGGASSKALMPKPKSASTPFFALNFARFRQNLKGFHKTTTNVQVVGFTDQDSHRDVLRKGAEGLGLKCNLDFLSLICSGGEVPDSIINGVPWTLGEYIKLHGGNQNRSKKVWGINIPIDVEEDGMKTHDSGFANERKRSSESTDTPHESKKPRTGTPTPVILSSDSESGMLEICIRDFTVKYSPVIHEKLCTQVIAVGILGVWRAANMDYSSSDDYIIDQIVKGEQTFLPERENFFAIEICKGTSKYLSAKVADGTYNLKNAVEYCMKEKRLVHSETIQEIDPMRKVAPLLVLSPHHGSVCYLWEKRGVARWELVFTPADTCILYAKCRGIYKCSVEGEVVEFEVIDSRQSAVIDGSRIAFEELTFKNIIGRGSFGEVHKGVWNGTTVALKRIRFPPETEISSLSIPKEVSVLKDLDHPNIITLFAYCITREEVVLVMNYVNGSNLDKLLFSKHLHEYKEVTLAKSVDIALKITNAVNYMHSHIPIVIHQDLKPQNVLVSSDMEKVYVCDMGLAKVKQLTESTVTCVNKGPGTFPYMAPEMFKQSRRGPAADIYSLGCLLIELFSRKRVWPGLDGPGIMLKVLGSYNTPPQGPSTSHLPPMLQDLCTKLTILEPNERPKSSDVLEMVSELARSTSKSQSLA